MLRRKSIALDAYVRKKETYWISSLYVYLQNLEKKSKISTRQAEEVIKITTNINKTENRISIKKTSETKSWCFEKVNKISRPLSRLTKKKREDTNYQYYEWNKGYHGRLCRHQRILREYNEQLYTHTVDNPKN